MVQRDFWMGGPAMGVASSSAIIFCVPPDTVCTRLKLQLEAGRVRHYSGFFDALFRIGRDEGARGLWRGGTAACMAQFFSTGSRFAAYDWLKTIAGDGEGGGLTVKGKGTGSSSSSSASRAGSQDGGQAQQSQAFLVLQRYGIGLAAGVWGGIFASPFFIVKTQMQSQGGPGGVQHNHANFRAAWLSVYSKEGVAGYFRGMQAFMPRNMLDTAANFATYDNAKLALLKNDTTRQFLSEDGLLVQALASGVAGVARVLAMQPFDFAATRLFNQSAERPQYAGAADVIGRAVREEGILSVYQGGFANWCRMGPHTLLLFVFYERMKKAWPSEED